MEITNRHPKGKWIHVKKNGYTEKVWLPAYSTVDLPYVTSKNGLNLNAHEEAIIHVEEKFGIEVDGVEDTFKYTIAMTEGSTGGTTSLSATTLSVNEGLNTSFYVYPEASFYVSAYTVNNTSKISSIADVSASTITATVTNIQEDKNIFVGFAAFGA